MSALAHGNGFHLFEVVPLRAHGPLRWIARIAASVIAGLFVIIGAGETLFPHTENEGFTWEGAGVAVLGAWVVVSLIAAWHWEKLGGVSTVLAGVALGVFAFVTAGRNELLVALSLGLPLVLIGAAFLNADGKTSGVRAS